ncbi:MAG: polynucleotide kinase-phosphatase [Planctomycetota bacterium]
MTIDIPELCLVVLMGPSGSGKSTFARIHFASTEVLSSDVCRGLVSDDENDQTVSGDAFDVLHYIAGKRLALGKLTVVDATNVRKEDRASLVQLARAHDVLPVAIVLKMPEKLCQERNEARPDRQFGKHVIRNQLIALRRGLRGFKREGFRQIHVFESPDELASVEIGRTRLWNDRRDDAGPFDVIGDVHGCADELCDLLESLGYQTTKRFHIVPPPGRKAVFVGDLVDRGPDSLGVLNIVRHMVAAGTALCVPGNHDAKLLKALKGRKVQRNHGLAETMDQIEADAGDDLPAITSFLNRLVSHYVLDVGKLVVAHAGLKEKYIGRASRRVREFALYGDTTGETDEHGLPVRLNWAADYRGDATLVYGHTPVADPQWLNNTVNIDTGCVFGGKLTALRWPEREFVSVPAKSKYAEPGRPFLEADRPQQYEHDDVLDLADVTGKRVIETCLQRSVIVRAENAAAALEVMSRFTIDPRWLIHLPPTMSPCETSKRDDLLEHPDEAFNYFRNAGIECLVCQEKHMGSRAIVVVCRDESLAIERFGVESAPDAGVIYTRTGRPFFDDGITGELLNIVRNALTAAGFWDEFETDWFCLDCELMPWSAKAQDLLRTQYAAVGSAAEAGLSAAIEALRSATLPDDPHVSGLLQRTERRREHIARYVDAYRRYCWPVASVADLKLAPFHLLASEGKVHTDGDHAWHMSTLARLAGGPVIATNHRVVELADDRSVVDAVAWWEQLTGDGGEGIVVKPIDWINHGPRGFVQPAMKVRGREYLRIIYGPEYISHLAQLRGRHLGGKRSMALREFSLGLEALHRFIDREPLRRVHECVFGVLALESEPVDPRL